MVQARAWSHDAGRDGAMVKAGRMVEPCRVRKGDGMLLHVGTWSHGAGKADGVTVRTVKMEKRLRQKGWKEVVSRRIEECCRPGSWKEVVGRGMEECCRQAGCRNAAGSGDGATQQSGMPEG